MRTEPLYLTEKDIELLKYRNLEIGRGSDGIVYKTGNYHTKNDLYKIYYSTSEAIKRAHNPGILDKNGVRVIKNKEQLRNIYGNLSIKTNYIDEEGVRINGINAVNQAIERQKYIQRTKLQKRPIYIDNHFGGTVLHYHKKQLPMYILKSLSKKTQIKVLKELLLAVEELVNNYVYHIDLGFQPKTNYKKANVLISCTPSLHPNIIDIDGKSAIYTENYNEYYYYKSLATYKNLVMQILFDIDIINITKLDFDYLKINLLNQNIPSKYMDSLLLMDKKMDIPELKEFLNEMEEIYSNKKYKTKKKILH